MEYIVGLAASPRRGGNSEHLLDSALKGVRDFETRKIRLIDYNIKPCMGCEYCRKTGVCVQKDDFAELLEIVMGAAGIILASPVYFYSLPGHAKSFIDRFQPLWEQKYRLKTTTEGLHPPYAGGYISVAGSGGERVFECIRLPYKYMLDTMSADMYEPLVLRNHDSSPKEIPSDVLKKGLEYGENFSIFLQKYRS